MEIAKMTSKGQLTVPKAVREKLNLKTGSKVVFVKKGDDVVVQNADAPAESAPARYYTLTEESIPAMRKLQEAFEGFAEEEGLETEDDVVEFVKALRRGDIK